VSLINEALQRARQESRRREALAKGLPLAPPPHPVSHRSWMVAAVMAMALALIVSLVTIARLTSSQPTTSAGVAASSAEIDMHGEAGQPETSTLSDTPIEPTAATDPAPESRADAINLPTPTAEASQPPLSPEDQMPQATEDSSPFSDTSASRQSPAVGEERTVTSSPSSTELANPPIAGVSLSPSARDRGSEDSPGDATPPPRVFIERATLASGDTLELGGIAWSETGPYALLDERVVGLGESIMGYMVTRIAPQEVELEGSDEAILIRLK